MMLEPAENKDRPEAPNWLIENIAEASKNARKIYFVYVGFLVYCLATITGTSDRLLVLNDTVRLPIAQIEVSVNSFFVCAPLIAIFVFVYFQLYLYKIKELIGDLRANYARPEKRRLYPWILNIADDPEPGMIGKVQTAIAKFSIWWLLPIVLCFFAVGFVRKHNPVMSYIIGATPTLGTLVVLWFWCHYESIDVRAVIPKRGKLVAGSLLMIVVISFLLAFNVLLLFLIIPSSHRGEGICVDLSSQKLVTEQDIEYRGICWADLRGVHLEGAKLNLAVLRRANLENANLWKAFLERADLQQARLVDANLEGAFLRLANLEGADLEKANLEGANLDSAELEGASLSGAQLKRANLSFAELERAIITEAKLEGADLRLAKLRGVQGLTLEQLTSVKTLYKCDFDSVMMDSIQTDYPHLLLLPPFGEYFLRERRLLEK